MILCLSAGPAWAVQAHGGAEGLVSHQLGHILLTVGMGCMLVRIKSLKQQTRGWKEFRLFLWLLIAWSLLTFAGHWLHELVARDKFFVLAGEISAFRVESFADGLFYLSRLDHLLLLPAFLFLLSALRKWSQST